MEYLIEKGAEVNAKDRYELSALHHAAMRGNVGAIKTLLAADGIQKEVENCQKVYLKSVCNLFFYLLQPKDKAASTPLHLAATYNHIEAAKVLLDNGANPRAEDQDSRTALHEACLEGNREIAELLLKEGTAKFGADYTKSVSFWAIIF